MENIHIRLKELRKSLNLTQSEMAAQLGMAQPAWARLESGGVPDPRCSTIVQICKKFNVDPRWLLGFIVFENQNSNKEG